MLQNDEGVSVVENPRLPLVAAYIILTSVVVKTSVPPLCAPGIDVPI